MQQLTFDVRPIGQVESELIDIRQAPCQGDEAAPDAWLVFNSSAEPGLGDIHVDDEILVLTWFHKASRDAVTVHPRGDTTRPLTGVFSTRSPDRPNPIGIHRVRVLRIEGARILVNHMEALNETPIIDVKPVIGTADER